MPTQMIPGLENFNCEQVTIRSGQSLSTGVETQGRALCGILMPTIWTAASIRFRAGLTDNMKPVYSRSGFLSVSNVVADAYIAFPMQDATYGPGLQLESCNADGSAVVNQAQDVTLLLFFRTFLT